jgi:hypothetical protein
VIYRCCNENRKAAVLGSTSLGSAALNGIDYLEVLDHAAIPLHSPRQRTLLLHCLNPVPTDLTPSNVLIQGGESITAIAIQWIAPATPAPSDATADEQAYFTALPNAANILVVRTAEYGDFSPYTLRLVNDAGQALEDSFAITEILTGFDPQLAEVTFSFKVECGPSFDCAPAPPDCALAPPTPPPINYLAKDYGGFRGIMLDRLNQLLPNWGATSEADIGVMLAELVSYVGDYLSYQQDAIATEAYIETARSRISLRRHALLVDYRVHDGCNARAWVQLQVVSPVFMDHRTTRFYTYAPGMPLTLAVGSGNEEAALIAGVVVFEPMQDAMLFPEHNQMSLYTWGDTSCCLPQRATEATLFGTFPNLQPGDVLIFQEMIGPQTGNPADADLRHRCAVRLTAVATHDAQGNILADPLFDADGDPILSAAQTPAPVTEIQWSADDALPFAVCLSSTFLNGSGDRQTLTDVSVAFGNVVLADQGLSFTGTPLGTVPDPSLYVPPNPAADHCAPASPAPLPVRYRPPVPDSPITQAVPLPLAGSPVTPGIVMLNPTGYSSLSDSNAFVSLMIGPDDPLQWPQYFVLATQPNAIDSANFDLAVLYSPAGGPSGITPPVILESFPNLSLTSSDPNYAPARINTYSQLIRIPSSYMPPTTAPSGFPTTTTRLPNTGTVELVDTDTNPYLTVQPTSPISWIGSFGVLAQGNQQTPSSFNLVVVYNPASGGVGVSTPVTVELFSNLSLAAISDQISSASELITVESFSGEPNASLSAHDLMNYDPADAVPVITLQGTVKAITTTWTAQQNLLEAGPADPDFVVEVESTGAATLRFGDNTNGLTPESGTVFTADYRIGNGTAGNVGAGSLVFLATADARIAACTNPLPAAGGAAPETNDQIRRRAPQAFLTQERAVSMADYAAIVERNAQVDDAVATLRWTGSWYTVFIAAEPQGAGALTPALRKTLTKFVDRYRLAGQDVLLESPQYLPLQIELEICVDPAYFTADVRQSLLQVLGCGLLLDGQKALFYPDNFTFGQTVYLSPIYAAARSVAGVTSVRAKVFEPQGMTTKRYLARGEIPLGSFQVARLDNDPSLPANGRLTLSLSGGK